MTTVSVSTAPAAPAPGAAPAAPPAPAPGAAAPAVAQRPANIPEKFWDAATGAPKVDALASAYGELERTLSTRTAPPQPGAQPNSDLTLDLSAPPAPPAVSAALDAAFAESTQAQDGQVSPETLAKLATMGFDRSAVDRHIAGNRALVAQQRSQVYAAAGGAEEFGRVQEWAKTNLTREEKVGFNQLLATGNPDIIKMAVSGVAARYRGAVGQEATLTNPTGGSNGGGGHRGFTNIDEQTAAVTDPRYKTDAAYRNGVIARIGARTF